MAIDPQRLAEIMQRMQLAHQVLCSGHRVLRAISNSGPEGPDGRQFRGLPQIFNSQCPSLFTM